MPTDKDAVLALVLRELEGPMVQDSLIYWDQRLLRQGETVRMGPVQEVAMPFEGTLVFVDLAPRSNWAHPCLYLLVSAQDDDIQRADGRFPPFVEPPGSTILLLRYGKAPPRERFFQAFDE